MTLVIFISADGRPERSVGANSLPAQIFYQFLPLEIWTTLLNLKEGIFSRGRIRPSFLAEKGALQAFMT